MARSRCCLYRDANGPRLGTSRYGSLFNCRQQISMIGTEELAGVSSYISYWCDAVSPALCSCTCLHGTVMAAAEPAADSTVNHIYLHTWLTNHRAFSQTVIICIWRSMNTLFFLLYGPNRTWIEITIGTRCTRFKNHWDMGKQTIKGSQFSETLDESAAVNTYKQGNRG